MHLTSRFSFSHAGQEQKGAEESTKHPPSNSPDVPDAAQQTKTQGDSQPSPTSTAGPTAQEPKTASKAPNKQGNESNIGPK